MTLSLGASHFLEVCAELGAPTLSAVTARLRAHLRAKYGEGSSEYQRHYANIYNYIKGNTQDYQNPAVGENLNSFICELGFQREYDRPPKEFEFRFDGPHGNYVGRFVEKARQKYGVQERFVDSYVMMRLSAKALDSQCPVLEDDDFYDLTISKDGDKSLAFTFRGRLKNKTSCFMGHAVHSRCLYLIGVGDKLEDAALFILDTPEDHRLLLGTQMLRLPPRTDDGIRLPPVVVARKVAAIRHRYVDDKSLKQQAMDWLLKPSHSGLVVDFNLDDGSGEVS
ncbi:hypothetical protein [Brevundimonas aveniformis]|uniref:hypothetical protein n=1 Tax=Brevundimonas aveniformis TaxID=370977 RepID=UPI0012EB49F4|nr:hypothetical protein [Brevundimonas aveniformis]